jgi:hypothetical protein
MTFWGGERTRETTSADGTRLIREIISASGVMPNVEAHRRYLETLSVPQLEARLSGLSRTPGRSGNFQFAFK